MFTLDTDKNATALTAAFNGLVDAIEGAYHLPYSDSDRAHRRFRFATYPALSMGNYVSINAKNNAIIIDLRNFEPDFLEAIIDCSTRELRNEYTRLHKINPVDANAYLEQRELAFPTLYPMAQTVNATLSMRKFGDGELMCVSEWRILISAETITNEHIALLSALLKHCRLTPRAPTPSYRL